MDIAAAVDRHFDYLMDLKDQADAVMDMRADEIYGDLWDECKQGKYAARIVDLYVEDAYETLATILCEVSKLSNKGAIPEANRGVVVTHLMAQLTKILSDAADDMAESEA